ncbi:hypothetical protein ACC780_38135, partial [Rhizobium ruizarguesonis]
VEKPPWATWLSQTIGVRQPSRPLNSGQNWMPVPVEHILRAVSVQMGDEASVLEHYRRLIAFRKLHPAFAKGEIEFEEKQG